MLLNTLSPAEGSRPERRRVGRGIGCTLGKTCGKGHKGQKARAGGFHKLGFEGGQMPLQRRLPKLGFSSRKKLHTSEVRVDQLNKIAGGTINLKSLKDANLIPRQTKWVSIIDSGSISVSVTIIGLRVTPGARAKIEAAGGKVEV